MKLKSQSIIDLVFGKVIDFTKRPYSDDKFYQTVEQQLRSNYGFDYTFFNLNAVTYGDTKILKVRCLKIFVNMLIENKNGTSKIFKISL